MVMVGSWSGHDRSTLSHEGKVRIRNGKLGGKNIAAAGGFEE